MPVQVSRLGSRLPLLNVGGGAADPVFVAIGANMTPVHLVVAGAIFPAA